MQENMCHLGNIAMRDYQESVTTGQTHRQTDAWQSDPNVPLCFAGDGKIQKNWNSKTNNFSNILRVDADADAMDVAMHTT